MEEVAKEPHISPCAAVQHFDQYHPIIVDKKPDRRIKPPMANGGLRCYVAMMGSFLSSIILPIAVAAVALVLLLGLINMMRGGSPNTSQKLMRLRVLLQFVAIVITMLAVWAMGR
jgi:Hypoxia induced protein conserved region